MKPMMFATVAALLVAWLSGCATHTPRPATDPVPLDTTYDQFAGLTYTPPDWSEPLSGDLYRPTAAGPHPAVVLIHGGGWTRRSRNDMEPLAGDLARRGYVVFNISYRFAPEHHFPAQLRDVQQAVKWLRAHADHYGIDPARVAGMGYSSGAHLAAMVGMLGPDDALYVPESRLQALVLGGAPMDLRDYSSGSLVPDFLGTADGTDPVYAQASPVIHVSPDDPPTFLYHGKLDVLVRARYARAAFEAMQTAGVPAELYVHPLREHVTMFIWGGGAEHAAIDFLDRQFR